MDKRFLKNKSKSREKSDNKKSAKNIKSKKIVNKPIKSTKSPKINKKRNISNNISKIQSKKKKGKKGKSSQKKVKEEKTKKTESIMITQKLDGIMFVKNKKKKTIKKKVEKTFSEIKIGTPHFDPIPNIKKMITEKEKLINELNEEKKILKEKMRNIYNKLDGIETLMDETPEQKSKMTMLLFILNLNKKNYISSTEIKNKYKKEYNDLLIKNKYDPIENLINIGNKINSSRTENFEISKLIGNLKNCSRYGVGWQKNKKEKNYSEIVSLINELSSLNNQKQKALIKLKNTKKIINSSINKFKGVLAIYDENQISNQKLLKLDRDINLLKNDLLINDENELYNKIYNGQSLIFNSYNINIAKLKILKNTPCSPDASYTERESKNILKNKSTEYLKINSNFLNETKDMKETGVIKKKMFKRNILPKINNYNYTNNKSSFIEQNEINPLNKSIRFEELSETKMNEINLHEINFKKEYYKIIDKKLENSIKDIENMYKRKIKNTEDLLNSTKKKYNDIKKNNDLLKIEIENLRKIIHIQLKDIIDCS